MKTKQNGIKQMKESKKDNKYKQSIRCIKYEVKLLKKQMKQGITENSILSAVEEQAVEAPREYSEDIDSLKNSHNELEEALRCLKHEMKQLKSNTPEPIVSAPVEQTPVDLSPHENDIRCLKYEVKRLKEHPVVENIAPSAVKPPINNTKLNNSNQALLLMIIWCLFCWSN